MHRNLSVRKNGVKIKPFWWKLAYILKTSYSLEHSVENVYVIDSVGDTKNVEVNLKQKMQIKLGNIVGKIKFQFISKFLRRNINKKKANLTFENSLCEPSKYR